MDSLWIIIFSHGSYDGDLLYIGPQGCALAPYGIVYDGILWYLVTSRHYGMSLFDTRLVTHG